MTFRSKLIGCAHPLLAALAILVLLSAGQSGASAADLEAGKALAEDMCARCHAIGPADTSPHKDAPPFRSLGKDWPIDSLAEALAEGIVVGHPDMPEITLDPPDIENLLGFMKTVAE